MLSIRCPKQLLWVVWAWVNGFMSSISNSSGYSGDVWYPQPAPKDHPWRYMPNQAMTPHISGTTIDAQVLSQFHFFKLFWTCTVLNHLINCLYIYICIIFIILFCFFWVQLRYAAGVKDMLDRYFKGQDFPAQNYIVKKGELASQYRWFPSAWIYFVSVSSLLRVRH